MEIGKATAIFKNIDQGVASEAEKIEAINEVVTMPTHNGITKTDVLHALKWAMKYCWFLDCQNFSLKSVRDFQKNDIDRLERRIKHLLQSHFIRSFDEVNPRTEEYKRDIKEADKAVRCNCSNCMKATIIEERPNGEWIFRPYSNNHDFGDIVCSECKIIYFEGVYKSRMKGKLYNYCPVCGSKMVVIE